MPTGSARAGRAAGFTLLEVIVALVITGLALAALFSGATTGLRASHVSSDTMEAVSLARSHLAAVGRAVPLVAGEHAGDDGRGFRWRLHIAPLAGVPLVQANAPAPANGRPPQIVLFAVAVAESWSKDGGSREVEIDSQRIGEVAAAGP